MICQCKIVSNARGIDGKETKQEANERRTWSTNVGKMTFLISIHSSGLNFKLPSLSNNRSFVNLAQSSPNLLFNGSLPIAPNQFPIASNRPSKCDLYLSS